MVADKEAIARGFLDALARLDIEWLEQSFAEGASTFHPVFGEGDAQSYISLIRRAATHATDEIVIQAKNVMIVGEAVVIEARSRILFSTGKLYQNAYCFVFSFERDRIARLAEYVDTAPATAAMTNDISHSEMES